MAHVVAIANQQRGVGKTTTAVNLGAALAAAEARTLVVDLDPQGNASGVLGASARAARASLFGVLLHRLPLGPAIVRGAHLPLLDVAPASPDLRGAEAGLVSVPRRERRLRAGLDGLDEAYDYVLLDCPPELGLLSLNALVAADAVLVPLPGEPLALEGLSLFAETLRLVRKHLNPHLAVEGVLLTRFDGRRTLARQIAAEARHLFGGPVLRTLVPHCPRLAEAPGLGKPVLLYAAASPGAQAYLSLAREILLRSPGMDLDRHRLHPAAVRPPPPN